MLKKVILVVLVLLGSGTMNGQEATVSYKLNLVRHPVTKRYGYAFKEQNVQSPIRGVNASAVNLLGSKASVLIGEKDADRIDWAVPAQYDEAQSKFRENVAMVKVGDKVGFIDLHNRFVIKPEYDGDTALEGFAQGVAPVKKDGKWGYIDKLGKPVIDFRYEDADPFNEQMLAAVKQGEKWGAIDITGQQVVGFEYGSKASLKTLPTSNKEWREAVKMAKERVMNGYFEKKLSEIRAAAQRLNADIAAGREEKLSYTRVADSTGVGMKDQYGRFIVPQVFSQVKQDPATRAFVVEKEGKWGLYTYNGGRVMGPVFDHISPTSRGGRFTTQVYGVKGWISRDGRIEPNMLATLCTKGIETEKSDRELAVEMYDRALDINPEYAPAYNNLALIDFANKDYNKGMRKLKMALEFDPDNQTVADNLKQAKAARKERRSDRWDAGFTIAKAVITLGMTAYSTYSAVSGDGGAPSGSYTGSSDAGSASSASSSSSKSSNASSAKCKYCGGSGTCSPSTYVSRKNACHGSGLCGYCNGTGWISAGGSRAVCTACHGKGKCKTCGGTGKCSHCHGSGKR